MDLPSFSHWHHSLPYQLPQGMNEKDIVINLSINDENLPKINKGFILMCTQDSHNSTPKTLQILVSTSPV